MRIRSFYVRHWCELVTIKCVMVGLILRVMISRSVLGTLDEHSSLSLLISHDITHGHFSLTRYGSYTGSLEYFVAAPIVALWALTRLSSHVVALIFFAGTVVVYWRCFARTPYKNTMRYVLASLSVWPAYFLWESSRFSGIYASAIFVQAVLFASAYFAAHSLRNTRYLYIFMATAGVALWISPLTLLACVPAYAWILHSAPALKKKLLFSWGFFVLGSLAFWITVFTTKFAPLTEMFRSGTDVVDESPHSFFSPLAQSFSLRTFTRDEWSFTPLPWWAVALLVLSLAGLAALFVVGIPRVVKVKKTDFAYLIFLVIAAHMLLAAVLFIVSGAFTVQYCVLLIPCVAFVIVNARPSTTIITIAISVMFFSSLIALVATGKVTTSQENAAKSIATTLSKKKIDNVIASHSLAPLMDIASDDTVTVVPFDGNMFDSSRNKKVRKNIEAIVVDSRVKTQRDHALCIQNYFGEAFEAITVGEFDIYRVPKKYSSTSWEASTHCSALELYLQKNN